MLLILEVLYFPMRVMHFNLEALIQTSDEKLRPFILFFIPSLSNLHDRKTNDHFSISGKEPGLV